MRLANCKKLALSPINGIWFRAILPKHLGTALQSSHSVRTMSRFSPGAATQNPYEILYLAENQVAALYEVRALLGMPTHPVANPNRTKFAILDIQVKLRSVVDLTEPTQLKLLGISLQELTGNWDIYVNGDAPTQKLGEALFSTTSVEGFLTISAPASSNKNLIIFPQKLIKGSELVFVDASPGGKIHRRKG